LAYNSPCEEQKSIHRRKLSAKQLIALRHMGERDTYMTCECRLCGVILTRISDTCQGLYPYVAVRVQTFCFSTQNNHNGKHCVPHRETQRLSLFVRTHWKPQSRYQTYCIFNKRQIE